MGQDARQVARLAVDAMEEKRAHRVSLLDMTKVTLVTDYFLIGGGRSTVQVRAIADGVIEKLERAGVRPYHIEGYENARWILLDYGDVVVHVFLDSEREFYNLERLWGDAPQVEVERAVPG